MKEEGDLKGRTKDFALRIIRMFAQLPKNTVAQVPEQVLRSGTSIAEGSASWKEQGGVHRQGR